MYRFLFVSTLTLIVFLRPLVCAEADYLSNLIFNLVIFSVTIVWLLSPRLKKKFLFTTDAVNFCLFAFVLILIFSVIISVNKNRSLHYSFVVFSCICLFYLIGDIEKKHSLFLLKVFLVSAFLVAGYGVYQYFWGFESLRNHVQLYHAELLNLEDFKKRLFENRIYSTFVYAPALAGFFLVTIPLTIGFLSGPFRKAFSVFVYVFLCLQITALFLTFSKSGFFLILIMLLIYACLVRLKIRMRFVAWSLVIFLLLFNIFLMIGPGDFPTLENLKSSYSYRLGHYKAAISLIKERPFRGTGLMTFGLSYPKVMKPQDKETQYAHNCYLQLIQELGILGAAALIGFYVFYFKNFFPAVIREVKTNTQSVLTAGILVGILAFCLHSAVDNNFYFAQLLMSVFFLMAVVVSFRRKDSLRLSKTAGSLVKIFFVLLCALGLVYSYFCSVGYYRAESAAVEKDFGIKIKKYLSAVKWNPFNDVFYYRIAEIYENKWREEGCEEYYGRAEDFYRQAVFYNKMLPFYHYSLGNLYFSAYLESKDDSLLSRAIEQLDEAICLYPAKPYYRFFISDLLRIAGREQEAVMQYKKAQELKEASIRRGL